MFNLHLQKYLLVDIRLRCSPGIPAGGYEAAFRTHMQGIFNQKVLYFAVKAVYRILANAVPLPLLWSFNYINVFFVLGTNANNHRNLHALGY